ncbi:MAG TPA: hypothetical protein VG733_08025 [Chthoniobacteraceae bacterium]|nr:hypothetical protein [Chthoniobacteraceae bacterium]
MKIPIIACCLLLLPLFVRGADSQIDYGQIGTAVEIIGPLGKPLGKMIKIEGTLLESGRSKAEADYGERFMEVKKVQGVPLKKPVTIELKEGGGLRLPKGMANVAFTGYESGGFSGLPAGTGTLVQSRGWGFEVYFVVTRIDK